MALSNHELAELVREAIEAQLVDMHVAAQGTIHKYDAATRRAEINLVVKRPVNSDSKGVDFESIPPLQDVPVIFPAGMGGLVHITWPLQVGDGVLVHFTDYDPGQWLATGLAGPPIQTRAHSLGYAYATPGAVPKSVALAGASASALVLEHPSSILLGATATQFVALANLVKSALDTLQNAHDTHQHTAPSGGGATTGNTAPVGSLGDVAATKVKAQ